MIFTGVLDSLEREQAEELAKEYGATISKSVGPKLTHAVVGEEPGPSKISKLAQLKIPVLGTYDNGLNVSGKRNLCVEGREGGRRSCNRWKADRFSCTHSAS